MGILRIKNIQEHPEKNEVKGLLLSNIKTYIVTVIETMSGVGERIDSVHWNRIGSPRNIHTCIDTS